MGETYYCDDTELGIKLHQLFVLDGETEVEIHHPTEGVRIYTRKEWEVQQAELKRFANMSPAERFMETKRLERKLAHEAQQKRIRFRTSLAYAEVRAVDINDDSTFGFDIHGKDIPIEGMTFVHVQDYPEGTSLIAQEVGCFMDESLEKPPIRILTNAEETD